MEKQNSYISETFGWLLTNREFRIIDSTDDTLLNAILHMDDFDKVYIQGGGGSVWCAFELIRVLSEANKTIYPIVVMSAGNYYCAAKCADLSLFVRGEQHLAAGAGDDVESLLEITRGTIGLYRAYDKFLVKDVVKRLIEFDKKHFLNKDWSSFKANPKDFWVSTSDVFVPNLSRSSSNDQNY